MKLKERYKFLFERFICPKSGIPFWVKRYKKCKNLMIPLAKFTKPAITLFFLARDWGNRYSPAQILPVGAWPNGKAAAFGAED